jgi:hypothetical protein
MRAVPGTRSEPIKEPINTAGAQVEVRFLDPVGEIAGLDLENRVTTQDGAPAARTVDRGDSAHQSLTRNPLGPGKGKGTLLIYSELCVF